jgi:hypothetical protein
MNSDIFDDIMDDGQGSGMYDPVTGESFNPEGDTSNQTVNNTYNEDGDGGYRQLTNKDAISEIERTNPDDLITSVLRSKGFNPDSIKIQDDDTGEFRSERFADLSQEEQLEILNYDDSDFTEQELEDLEYLRNNNMSLSDFAQVIKNRVIQEIEQQNQIQYKVDDFTDDELFIVDFRNKYGEDISDEELIDELNKAKQNPDLFDRQVSIIRDNFKNIEQQNMIISQEETAKKAKEEEEAYIGKVVNIARNMNDIHDTVEMTDRDKENVLAFMFDRLPTGETAFSKALKDPATCYRAAWYIQNGDDVFRELHNYYKREITRLSRQQKPQAYVKDTRNTRTTTTRRPLRLEDLY